ncbi:HAD family phosphatase [Naumannella sp. ID2617S]|nr:HAD family phosphatase [Naumannella sp. ID2617S]
MNTEASQLPASGPRVDPTPPAAVLWDFDGTLVDSEPIWMRVEFQLVGEWGGSWSDELAYQMVGNDLRETSRHLIEASGRPDLTIDEVTAELVGRVAQELRTGPMLELRPGVAALLDELAEVDVPCALVSASYREVLDAVLTRLPANPFRLVVAGDDVTHGKPHPEPYLAACARLGVRPEECVVLEDSITGAASGNAAGAVVGVIRNHVEVEPAPRRFLLDTLAGVGVAELGAQRLRWNQPQEQNR